ncbi:MAG: Gfo/Idh/MocA family oxidoreductase [Planctomycetes bacterium]|nr:Gfo/Idh/MocA family oxidoreductase [Planctomycetota bacterium]
MRERSEMTRRRFMGRTLAGLGAAAALAPGHVLGANEKILLGSIGTGGRGTAIIEGDLESFREKGACAVVAVCDIYEPRLRNAKKIADAGCEAYRDFRQLLERKDIDACIIATPDHWHGPMSIAAAKAGKDIYCEKPMTRTVDEAKQVYETVQETKRVFAVGVQSASDDRYWLAQELIKEGAIGKVVFTEGCCDRNSTVGEWNYYAIDPAADPTKNLDWKAFLGDAPLISWDKDRFFRWRKYWDYSGGIATDLFYHVLGHLSIALGPEFPYRVVAGGGRFIWPDRDVPDTFHMIVDYPTRHSVVLTSTMANRTATPEVVRGHEGTLFFEEDGVRIAPEAEFKEKRQPIERKRRPRPDHFANFFECMKTRAKPHLDEDTGFKVMIAIGMGVEAFRQDRALFYDRLRQKVSDTAPYRPF